MDLLTQGLNFFVLSSANIMQQPFMTTNSGNSTVSHENTEGGSYFAVSTDDIWKSPAMQSMMAMLVVSTIPQLFQKITGWIYPGVYNKIIDMLYVTIEIQQEESIFYQIGQYVAEQEELNEKKLMHVQGFTKGQERSYHFFSHFDEQETSPKPQLSVLPQAGTKQIVNFKGKKIWVARKKRKSDDGTGVGNGLSGMNLDLTSLLQRNQEIFEISMRGRNVEELKSILQQWIDNIYYRDYNKLTVYQCMRIHFTDYGWKRISNKEMRNFESIVLREGQKEEILADVKKFLGAHKKYAMRGIPYRHAVILHGPPGTGKTSFIKGLAEKLKLNIAYISLVTSLDDDGFLSMLARVPANSVIVMEDFDRSHITEDAKESERNTGMVGGMSRITEAGLLNALDGINTPEGTLVFLTCNDITKINTAIKRPGRVDQIYHLDYADDYQIKEMLWRFFGKGEQTVNPEARKDNPHLQHIAEVFVSHARTTNHEKLTTATLQKFFLEYEKEQEIQYWKERMYDDKYNNYIATNKTDDDYLKQDIEKKKEKRKQDHVNNNEEKKGDDDEEESVNEEIDINLDLLMDKEHVQKLFLKIQTETSAEEKIRDDAAKKKEEERKKKEEEANKKEKKDDSPPPQPEKEEATKVDIEDAKSSSSHNEKENDMNGHEPPKTQSNNTSNNEGISSRKPVIDNENNTKKEDDASIKKKLVITNGTSDTSSPSASPLPNGTTAI